MSDQIHFPMKDNGSQGHFSALKIQHHRDLSLLLVPNKGKFRKPPTGEASKLWSQLTEPVSQFKIFSMPSDSR